MIEKKYNELSLLNNKKFSPHNTESNILKLQDINENSSDKIKNEVNLLKKLKNFKKFSSIKDNNQFISRKIILKNNFYNNLYKIERNNSIFINKSNNIKKNYLKNKEDNNSEKNNLNPIDDLGNSVKIKKNNKIIYMNKLSIKTKIKKIDIVLGRKKRSSLYRWVSKNGSNWQVIMSSKDNKGYVGMYKTQEIAARIYDIVSIKNKGIKAKTNFEYDLHQIQNISEAYIDYKSEDIEEIISDLINK